MTNANSPNAVRETAADLLKDIAKERESLIKAGKIKKSKPLPKITEDEIPYEIPENWEWVRLGDISKRIHYGYTASASDCGNSKLLRITDIQNNNVTWENVPFCTVHDADFEQYGLRNRDIVIARTGGTIGKSYLVNGLIDKTVFASYLIRVIPSDYVSEHFLKLFLDSPLYWMQLISSSTGTGQPNVNGVSLSKLVLALPPLSEQKEIVALLDDVLSRIDKARENIKKNIENADELYQRTVIDLFSNTSEDWETKKLKEVCSIISDGTHHTPKYFDSGYIFLSSRNVTSGVIDWKDVKYIDETQHISMQKRVSPRIGDILLAKNGTTGVAALVDRDVDFDIYVSLALLRPLDFIDPTYLLYVINSPFAKRQFNARLKGMGVPNLHLEEIRKVTIQYPKSKEKQREIVEKISALLQIRNNLKDNYTKKLQALDELRNSVLEKAFRGELTGNSTAQSVAAK